MREEIAERASAPVGRESVVSARLEFTDAQADLIHRTYAPGATPDEFAALIEVAKVRRLNPLLRQIWFVPRDRGEGWMPMVSIDGLRAIAERSGQYDGQDAPVFEYDSRGRPMVCRVSVFRRDWARPAVGLAHLGEYAPVSSEGQAFGMWAEKPHVMLAKCAEALALRKAFPEDAGGLYVPEELPPQRSAARREEKRAEREAQRDQRGQVSDADRKAANAQAIARAREHRAEKERVAKAKQEARRTPIIDVRPGETEEDAEARVKRELASGSVAFGPHRGRAIATVSDAELEALVREAAAHLEKSPTASWVGTMQANLVALRAEQAFRVQVPPAEGASGESTAEQSPPKLAHDGIPHS